MNTLKALGLVLIIACLTLALPFVTAAIVFVFWLGIGVLAVGLLYVFIRSGLEADKDDSDKKS